ATRPGSSSPTAGSGTAAWRVGSQELYRQFDRGMLTELHLPGRLAPLAADLRGLFAAEPIGAITFDAVGIRADHLRAARRIAVPRRPVRLGFRSSGLVADPFGSAASVLTSPLALAATEVNAAGCRGGAGLALVVARSPFLTVVKELNLDGNHLDVAAAA